METGTMIDNALREQDCAEQPGPAPRLRLYLLGPFRIDQHGQAIPDSAWQQRRTAKALVKLLASDPGHALHREQVLESLWPDADLDSAINSLGKALHVARRALEPDLAPRGQSSYLHLKS